MVLEVEGCIVKCLILVCLEMLSGAEGIQSLGIERNSIPPLWPIYTDCMGIFFFKCE